MDNSGSCHSGISFPGSFNCDLEPHTPAAWVQVFKQCLSLRCQQQFQLPQRPLLSLFSPHVLAGVLSVRFRAATPHGLQTQSCSGICRGSSRARSGFVSKWPECACGDATLARKSKSSPKQGLHETALDCSAYVEEKLTDQPVLKVNNYFEESVPTAELGPIKGIHIFNEERSAGMDVKVPSTRNFEILIWVNASTKEVQNSRQKKLKTRRHQKASGEPAAQGVTLIAKGARASAYSLEKLVYCSMLKRNSRQCAVMFFFPKFSFVTGRKDR